MAELKGLLQVNPRPMDVLGISETFLTENDSDARLNIEGYHQPERRNRCGKREGDCWRTHKQHSTTVGGVIWNVNRVALD